MNQIEQIIFEEAVASGVSVAEILSTDVSRDISAPRHRAMLRARIELGASYPTIGRAFKRDHKTVWEAIRKLQEAKGNNNAEISHAHYHSRHPRNSSSSINTLL